MNFKGRGSSQQKSQKKKEKKKITLSEQFRWVGVDIFCDYKRRNGAKNSQTCE